jgi:hypothetical protein
LSLIAPTGLLLFIGVRAGRWGDADVSVREERRRFYQTAIPLSACGTIVMWLANAPRHILRGGVVTLLLLISAAIINHWSKISLHFLFATYCTIILFRVSIFCWFGGINSGSTRFLVATSPFAPNFRKHQRCRTRHRRWNCHRLDVDLTIFNAALRHPVISFH